MAQIPLAQIPNAPDLSSMSAPQTNTVNVPSVDFTQERREVARAYDSAMENPNSAAKIGTAVQDFGNAAYKTANAYQEKQDKLQATAAKAEFDGLSASVMSDIQTSLDPSQPHTWAGQFNQKWQQVDDWYKSQPTNIQQAIYPEYIHNRYMNQASIGIAAHKTQLANQTNSTLQDIQQLSQGGLSDKAKERTEELMHSGGISVEKKNELFAQIDGTAQKTNLYSFINQNPDAAINALQQAFDTGSTIKGFEQIQGKELENAIKVAKGTKNWQSINAQTSVSSWVDANKDKLTMQAIEASSGFKALDDAGKQAVRDQFLNKYVAGTEEGAAATASAIGSVKEYNPSLDPDFSKLKDLTNQLVGTVPQAERQPLLDELTKKHDSFLKNGGKVPFDQQIVTDIHGQIHQMYSSGALDDRARFAKGTPEYNKEVQKGLQKYQYYVNQWDKMSAENPGNLGEAQQNFNQVIMKDDAKNSIKSVKPSSGGGFWNWIKGGSQQTSNDSGDSAGKITKYGYEKLGQADYDSNSANGIGAADNKLTPGESVALSPDLEKATGAKIGDKVVVTLSNGEKMVKRFDDRTSKRLKGRVDIYSPDGNQPLDGVKVAKVEKYTEDGQG